MAWRTPPGLWFRLKPVTRRMRRQARSAEALLWQDLRGGRLRGFKFRRQHPLGRFVVDFYCGSAGLVIELDGPVHSGQRGQDAARQSHLEGLGLRVLRFSNDEVLNSPATVLSAIAAHLHGTRGAWDGYKL